MHVRDLAVNALYQKGHLIGQPDLVDPAVDFGGFRRAVLRSLLDQGVMWVSLAVEPVSD
jgi:hypothetical protein